VRRYYRQDLAERLQRTFAPQGGRGGYNNRGNFGKPGRESAGRFGSRAPFTPGAAGRFEPRGGRGQAGPGSQTINRGPYQAASAQLATSPIMRGQRSAMSRREALILQSLINHPWLLHDHLEEVAALELAHPEANKLRAAIIAAFASDHHIRPNPTNRPRKCGPISRHADFRKYFKGLKARSRLRRCGAYSRGGAGRRSFHLATAGCLASENTRLT